MGHRSPSKQCPLPAACGRWGWRPTLREPSGQTNTVRCKVHCSKTLCQTSQCPSLWILSAGAEPAKRGVTYTTRSAPRTPRIAPDEAAQPALKRHFPACCEQRVVRFLCYRTVTGKWRDPATPCPSHQPTHPRNRRQDSNYRERNSCRLRPRSGAGGLSLVADRNPEQAQCRRGGSRASVVPAERLGAATKLRSQAQQP